MHNHAQPPRPTTQTTRTRWAIAIAISVALVVGGGAGFAIGTATTIARFAQTLPTAPPGGSLPLAPERGGPAAGGELPSDLGTPTRGTLLSKNDTELVLETDDGRTITVLVTSDVVFPMGSYADLIVGDTITVLGNEPESGTINAQLIFIGDLPF